MSFKKNKTRKQEPGFNKRIKLTKNVNAYFSNAYLNAYVNAYFAYVNACFSNLELNYKLKYIDTTKNIKGSLLQIRQLGGGCVQHDAFFERVAFCVLYFS